MMDDEVEAMGQRKGRLAGKTAIITGASRGLGMYCALAYAREGANVAVVGRSVTESNLHLPGNIRSAAEAIFEATGSEAMAVQCDIADKESVDRMVDAVIGRFHGIDILMNNAALAGAEGEGISQIAPRLMETMLRRNVLGPFYAIRAVLPIMRSEGTGSIINVSGRSRRPGSPLEMTKAAIETLTVGLAGEVAGAGIAVNSLRPRGFIDTPGVLINPDVKPRDLTPPDSYVEAAVLLAMQSASTYTGNVGTDFDVLADLATPEVVGAFARLNPPGWAEETDVADAAVFRR